MNVELKFNDFKTFNCILSKGNEEGSLIIEGERSGSGIVLSGQAGKVGGVDWSSDKFIAFDVVNHETVIMGVEMKFWRVSNNSDKADMTIIMGLIPDIKTRLCLPMLALNSQEMFLPRTPGKLKTVVFGNKVELGEVNRFSIGTMESSTNSHLEISNVFITDTEPDYPLADDVVLVDEIGQLKTKDWPGKTNGADELKKYLMSELEKCDNQGFPENQSKFGGWKEKQFEATGYFRTQHDGSRWWLVDPEGCAFISVGMDCVNSGEIGRIEGIEKFYENLPDKNGTFYDAWNIGEIRDPKNYYNFAVSNLIRAFGANWYESWAKITRRRLVEWGVNTVAAWSTPEFARTAKLPYVWFLSDFPETEKKIFRDFPDVFSPEYEANAYTFAQQIKEFEGDQYLIGYFLRNEPIWAFVEDLNIAEELLENESDLFSKIEFIKFISDRYKGSIESFNTAWGVDFNSFNQLKNPIKKASKLSNAASQDLLDFSKIMISIYVKIPSDAVKKVDPHHLNLGMRYAIIYQESLLSGCECFDVFSFNCYKMNPAQEAERIGKMTGLPVMIGEFHFGALDRGLLANGIRAVTTQEERGKAYRFYMENGAAEEHFVGAHYFLFNDQPLFGRFDGENFQVGCIDVCHKPYEELVEYIKKTTATIYQVAEGSIEKCNIEAVEIEKVGF